MFSCGQGMQKSATYQSAKVYSREKSHLRLSQYDDSTPRLTWLDIGA
jgi:hypothetical protein